MTEQVGLTAEAASERELVYQEFNTFKEVVANFSFRLFIRMTPLSNKEKLYNVRCSIFNTEFLNSLSKHSARLKKFIITKSCV